MHTEFFKTMSGRRLSFVPERAAELIDPRDEIALISISSPGRSDSDSIEKKWSSSKNFLKVRFHDVDLERFDQRLIDEDPEKFHKAYTVFSGEMAQEILGKIVAILSDDNVKLIIINCEAGVSRSAAVAQFIADYMDSAEIPLRKTSAMNRTVYKVLLNALRETVWASNSMGEC